MHPRWRTPVASMSIVALLAALAGTVGPTAGAVAEQPISYRAPVRMPPPLSHSVFGGASEPSIALDAEGGVYVTAACCLPLAAAAWYAKDGRTFSLLPSPGGVRENGVGAEGDFVVDDADRPILADTRIPSIVVTRWRDRGDTWERSVDASEVTVPLQDRPWLGWGQGALYLYVNGGLQNTYVYESYDYGVTWNPLPVGSFNGNFPTVMTASRHDGSIWLLGKNGFTGSNLTSAVSTDHGRTWRFGEVGTASRSGGTSPTIGVSIATDEAGNGYAVWSTFDANGCDVEMATSTDHGLTWSRPVRVNATGGCATFPWVDAGLPGRAVVAWYEADNARNQATMPTTATWHVHTAISTNALSASPTFVEQRLPGVTVDRGTLTTGYGQSGTDSRSLLDYFEVTVGPDGRFHIAYAENTTQANFTNTWYVGQAEGPLLHADRTAAATSASIRSAQREGDRLVVTGGSAFKRAPVTTLFPASQTELGGTVTRVGPDSDELLLTLLTPPNGAPGFDGLPGMTYEWSFSVGGASHRLTIHSRDATGPRFLLDGKRIGGTIDGLAGKAIARVPLSAIGAAPGSTITFQRPALAGDLLQPGTATYAVPDPTVRLALVRDGTEVVAGSASLDQVVSTFDGALDLTGVDPGPYTVVATACYAGACASATTEVVL